MTDSASVERGKVAIVTGAASGIGAAIAEQLHADGWRLVLADRSELPTSAPGLAVATDISQPSDVDELYRRSTQEYGRVDAVINVAGITKVGDVLVEDLDVALFDEILAVNLRGTFLMCRGAIKALRAVGGGAIVNFGSTASIVGIGGGGYVASKSGVAGLSRVVAYQNARDGIRCNTVAPGATDTPMIQTSLAKGTAAVSREGCLAGMARTEDIAVLVSFLISDAGRFVTGAMYTVDGGLTQH